MGKLNILVVILPLGKKQAYGVCKLLRASVSLCVDGWVVVVIDRPCRGASHSYLILICTLSLLSDSSLDQSKTSGMGMLRKQENMTCFPSFTQTETDSSSPSSTSAQG